MTKHTMLDPDQALGVLERLPARGLTERLPLLQCLGRALAEEVRSTVDSPPFAKAAMDGYAVAGDEDLQSYRLVETIAAGTIPRRTLQRGECAKIMTGAMLPVGAGKVIRVEYTEEVDGAVRVVTPEPARNIIERGENLKAGEPALGPQMLRPQDVGILASLGVASVRVALPPQVGIVTTGSELAEPGEQLRPGAIYNSNGWQLCAQVSRVGCPYTYYGTVADEPESLEKAVARALEENDVVLLSGGVSMGDLDYVPQVVRRTGARILFHKLAIKPGKPTLFAQKKDKYLFGLPGNPVSTFVIFEVFVKTLLYRWMGLEHRPAVVRARLAETLRRRDAERVDFRPVRLEGAAVRPLSYHGSSHLNALGAADGLIRIERGNREIKEGSELDVRLI
ncbi:MAG: molybdopterin molybdotransferase MoeA [Spirochaetales bacterium]|nr:molybdopterin molybdotransferase MoeA [Spirochaetales bacterium]